MNPNVFDCVDDFMIEEEDKKIYFKKDSSKSKELNNIIWTVIVKKNDMICEMTLSEQLLKQVEKEVVLKLIRKESETAFNRLIKSKK
jgi:hypothetical protein